MKKIHLLPFLALSIAACGGDRIETSSPGVPPAPNAATSSPEDDLVDYVKSNLPSFSTVSDATIIETIEVTCGSLDAGMSASELALGMAEAIFGMSYSEASDFGEFVGAGVRIMCPEHVPTVMDAADILISGSL